MKLCMMGNRFFLQFYGYCNFQFATRSVKGILSRRTRKGWYYGGRNAGGNESEGHFEVASSRAHRGFRQHSSTTCGSRSGISQDSLEVDLSRTKFKPVKGREGQLGLIYLFVLFCFCLFGRMSNLFFSFFFSFFDHELH